MTEKHNTLLHDGLMLDAASGAAPAAVCMLAACQAELNADAADRVEAAETAFGALLETGPLAAMEAGAFAKVMAQLDLESVSSQPNEAARPSALPSALDRVLAEGEPIVWRRRFGGMQEHVVESLCEPGVHVRLLKLPIGWRAPEHAHGGDEITLVISGAFEDEAGRYAAGDVCHASAGHRHRPVVDGDEDCLCLVIEFGQLLPTNPALSLAARVLGRLF